jgi:trigger factor
MTVDQIKTALGGNVDGIKGDLQVKKAVEFLVENSKTVA